MVAPALPAPATTIYIHDDLVSAKFEARNLDLIAGVDRRAMIGDGAIQQFIIQRVADVNQEAFFSSGHGLDGFGKFAGNVPDQ